MPVLKRVSTAAKPVTAVPGKRLPEPKLVPSKLKIFDIPDELLVDSEENPNEQDDTTLDLLTQKIKAEGIDEPLQVVPHPSIKGKYYIVSGHHRRKAGKLAGLKAFPCVIKQGWDEDRRKIELVGRNMLRGAMNPEKFTKLFVEMRKKGYDEALLKAQMGFTKKDAFDKLFKQVSDNLPNAARKKLAEAKETVTSVDGLSSVLNNIFKEHGSDLDRGFIVFDFGGKKHHYIPVDAVLSKSIERLEERCRAEGANITAAFNHVLANANSIPLVREVKKEALVTPPKKLVRPPVKKA